ncbi:MAG: hypothetical protein KDA28_17290, partial [Phycisphaerales bacterium]|nr:hypothetical protein [Phycisphaerales bacterium]
RRAVAAAIDEAIGAGRRVLHVGMHSFTDVLDGCVREVDVGLLFDPTRPWESEVCRTWKAALDDAMPSWRHRWNEPYLGIDDGFTTFLRSGRPDAMYAGIEVEGRQGLLGTPEDRDVFATLLERTLRTTIDAMR